MCQEINSPLPEGQFGLQVNHSILDPARCDLELSLSGGELHPLLEGRVDGPVLEALDGFDDGFLKEKKGGKL